MCDLLDFIYECFVYAYILYASVHSKWNIDASIRSNQQKIWYMLVYSWYDYNYCVRQWLWRLEWIWIFIHMPMWKSGMSFVEVLLVFDRKLTFENVYIIYLLGSTVWEWQ